MNKYKLRLIKAFCYRIFSFLITWVILFVCLGEITQVTAISIVIEIMKTGPFYLFETIWEGVILKKNKKSCFCSLCDFFKKWKRIKKECKCKDCCPHYEEDAKDICYTSMYPYELGCFATTYKDTSKNVIEENKNE